MMFRFINRDLERTYLSQQINEFKKSKFIVVRGDSGVGKSELTKITLEKNDDVPSIKASINQRGIIGYEDGHYLRVIGKELDECSKKTNQIISFREYIRGFRTKALNKRILDVLREEAHNWIPGSKSLDFLLSKSLNTDEYSNYLSFTSQDSDYMILIEDYISQQFIKSKIVLNIENIQSIDGYSLMALNNIIEKSNNVLAVYEYTTNSNLGYDYNEIIQIIETTKCKIETIAVDPLSVNDIREIIDQNPKLSWDIFQNSFTKWNGNLRPIVDIFAQLKYDKNFAATIALNNKSFSINESTINHLQSLKKAGVFLLTIILNHYEPVDLSMFSFFKEFRAPHLSYDNLEETLEDLTNRGFIRIEDSVISIDHDSIYSNLEKLRNFPRFSLIAINYWYDFYTKYISDEDFFIPKSKRLQRILFFSVSLKKTDTVHALLDKIERQAINSRSPETMMKYVLMTRERLLKSKSIGAIRKNIIDDLEIWIVELFHKIGNPQKTLDYISAFRFNNTSTHILKGISLANLGRHNEALQLCEKLLNRRLNKKDNIILSIEIIRLLCYEGLNLEKEKKDLFFALLGNDSYSNLLEYGFLLRNSELIFPHNECIPYLKKSIKIFKTHNAKRQEGYSRNSLAFHLARMGLLKKASKQLRIANDLLVKDNSERHTILNNQAAILLYKEEDYFLADEMLRIALLSAEMSFDRITIHSNRLVLADRTNNLKLAKSSIKDILRILKQPSFSDKEIIRQVFFNISKHYEQYGKYEKSRVYIDKIRLLNLNLTAIWDYWLNDKDRSDLKDNFQSNFDRSIAFLSHWNINFDNRLMKY